MTFSLELSSDLLDVQKWVHEFAADVVRPAAPEWDEREETPWPVIAEAAKIGLYSMEFFAEQAAEPSGLGMIVAFEEMFWGDAGIALSILGTGLAAASLAGSGTPEQIAERIAAYRKRGVDLILGGFLHFQEEIEYFGARVLPLVREIEESERNSAETPVLVSA